MQNQVTHSIIVNGSAADIYNLWTRFEDFPNFMRHVKSVTKMGSNSSRWVIESPPVGVILKCDVEITRMEPNKRIAWNSKDNSGDIKTSGQVTFTALPKNQTEITVTLQCVPPDHHVSQVVARLFGNLDGKLADNLRNFKAYAEDMPQRIA